MARTCFHQMLVVASVALALAGGPARAQSEASLVLSALPVASVVGTGVLLSAAGEVLCFIPNEIGRALLHNERITY